MMRIINEIFRKFFLLLGLDETTKLVESMGGWCKSQIVDISNRHAVYKAAAEIKNNFGDVSKVESPQKFDRG